jgi:1-acyl-sn-glycerol-3-phosphate acyltransferase
LPGVAIQPIALKYFHHGQRSQFAAFVGEETLIQNLWRVLGGTGVEIETIFLPPIITPGMAAANVPLTADEVELITPDAEPIFEYPPRNILAQLARASIQNVIRER